MKIYVGTVPKKSLEINPRTTLYKKYKTLFGVAIVLVSIAPVLTISGYLLMFYQKIFLEQTTKDLLSLATSYQEKIDLYLTTKKEVLKTLVELYPQTYWLNHQNLEKIYQRFNQEQNLLGIEIFDQKGQKLAFTSGYQFHEFSKENWTEKVLKDGWYVSELFIQEPKKAYFFIAIVVPSKSWILICWFDGSYLFKTLDTLSSEFRGQAYLINLKGQPQGLNLKEEKELVYLAPFLKQQQKTLKQNSFLYVSAKLQNADWLLICKSDLSLILSSFYQARGVTFIFIALISVVIGGIGVVIITYLINKLEVVESQRLEIATRMLETEKMALVGRLASNVAHEINNPLQIIDEEAGWIEDLLKEEDPLKVKYYGEYQEAVGKIKKHIKRAKTITHKLLSFARSRIEDKGEVDINQLIEETTSFLKNTAERRRIVIRKFFDPQIPKIITSFTLLQQAFLNILNNAVDAIGEEGIITITTKLDEANKVVVIEIADSGPGIPEELLSKIFEPFFSTKKGGRNVGLGLSITYSFIKRLGGDIYVRNGKKGGAIFTIVLPLTVTQLTNNPPQKSNTTSLNKN